MLNPSVLVKFRDEFLWIFLCSPSVFDDIIWGFGWEPKRYSIGGPVANENYIYKKPNILELLTPANIPGWGQEEQLWRSWE